MLHIGGLIGQKNNKFAYKTANKYVAGQIFFNSCCQLQAMFHFVTKSPCKHQTLIQSAPKVGWFTFFRFDDTIFLAKLSQMENQVIWKNP